MSGVSGVRGHQVSLDVVGNNIANVNTAGYKRSSITFQDLLYQNTSGTAAPNDQRGGVNAKQVGLGMQVSAIEVLHTQGTTQYTGSRTDFAIQGDGYFVVLDGNSKLYTRAGNFTLDAKSNLVQAGTGYKLQGYQIARDPIDPQQFNQGSTLTDINIPTGQKMEARQTTVVGYRCNLDSGADTFLPMGLLGNNFSTTATLKGQRYSVNIQEGTTADAFMTMNIGDQALTFRLTGVDSSSGRPMLEADPLTIGSTLYDVDFDSATGKLTLTELVGEGIIADQWSLNLSDQMDYQTFTVVDGANRYSYLAEFTDITEVGREGYQTLRIWGVDYKGDMEVFQFPPVPMNDDGTFNIDDEDTANRLAGFAGGSFIAISNATGGRGVQLTSTKEIVDANSPQYIPGINAAVVQNVSIAGNSARYTVTVTEGDPDGSYVTLRFVDKDDSTKTSTLRMSYAGLNSTGSVELSPLSTFTLGGKTYQAVYTSGATNADGVLMLNDVTDPLTPLPGVWSYALGSQMQMGNEVLNGSLRGTFRTEFDDLGAGEYKFTFLGEGTQAVPGRILEVNASNFRQYMGVLSIPESVNINGEEYTVTPREGSESASFMTLDFLRASDGATASVNFALAGVDGAGRVLMRAVGDLVLPDGTFTRDQISYNAETRSIAFNNGNLAESFSTQTGKYVNFQVAQDNLGNRFLVDFDEVDPENFTMKTWTPGALFSNTTGMTFAGGNMNVPASGLPLTAGTVEFSVGGARFRDNGSNGLQQLVGAVWTGVPGATINYLTGAITGLQDIDPLPASDVVGPVTSWSSVSHASRYTRTSGIEFVDGVAAVPAAGRPISPGSVSFRAPGGTPYTENLTLTPLGGGTVAPAGLPIYPGTVSFTANVGGTTFDFQDDGSGGFEYYDTGTSAWVSATGGINYATGAITNLEIASIPASGNTTSWSSRIIEGTSLFTDDQFIASGGCTVAGHPLLPGTISFTLDIGGTPHDFQDDGAGGFVYSSDGGTTWNIATGTGAISSNIDYNTGVIANLGVAGTDVPDGPTSNWQSEIYMLSPYATDINLSGGSGIVAPAGLPILPESISFRAVVSGVIFRFRDDGAGNFEYSSDGVTWAAAAGLDGSSTINYTTGVISNLGVGGVAASGNTMGWQSRLTDGLVDYRDNGSGAIEARNAAGTWVLIPGSTINYLTGAIEGLGMSTDGEIVSWSSNVASGATSSVAIPVTQSSGEVVATANQRIANVHNTKIDVYDSLGNPYTLEVSWEKLDNGVWRWRAWLPDSDLSITENTGLLRFGPDGKLVTGDAQYNTNPTITIQFDEAGARRSEINLDFSGESFQKDLLDGVTQYGSPFTTKGYYQDGYDMGVLTDFAVAQDGTVNGIYSNGQNIPLYRVALALFANPAGLVKTGNTAFSESNNSGIAQIGSPQEGGAGSIIGSSLEMSNVDLTEEFTKLITSQRGFQANARMITTSDQVLEELINIKR